MRALVLILDSVGVGNAPDAAQYGDAGANTLGHILQSQPVHLPTLASLGLNCILGLPDDALPQANYGRLREVGAGKDTTTGHWELMGVVLDEPFAVYEQFPPELVDAIEADAGVKFIGNYACSGTQVLEELGAQHLESGHPILYTSADSVLQIAAHEAVVPVARLYEICEITRRIGDDFRIGRVIARPFEGEVGSFKRTWRRHDFSFMPPRTVLNALQDAGVPTIGIGKISDIFAGSGISQSHPTLSNQDGMETIERVWNQTRDGFILANLVDFDSLFGHRRDVAGYARALQEFDAWLQTFLPHIGADDLLLITADHGNDPTMPGTDHTREEVPLFAIYHNKRDDLGIGQFADVAATMCHVFKLKSWPVGNSLFKD